MSGRSRASKRGASWRVDPDIAREAWSHANGDRSKAYVDYINLHLDRTGILNPGCDNVDLQAWIDLYGGGPLWSE